MNKILLALILVIGLLLISSSTSFALITGYGVAQPIQGVVVTPYQAPSGAYTRPVGPSGMPCFKRPACLDAHPRCMIAEPIGGWCNTTPTPLPTPIHCGGFIKNAPTCPSGYTCRLGRIPDTGGTCVPNVTMVPSQTPPGIPVAIAAGGKPTTVLGIFFSNFTGFFTHIFSFWK